MNRLSKWLWRQRVKNVEVVYELKPGGYYLIEYQEHAIPKATTQAAGRWLESKDIHVLFIANPTHYRVFEPIPATPSPKGGS